MKANFRKFLTLLFATIVVTNSSFSAFAAENDEDTKIVNSQNENDESNLNENEFDVVIPEFSEDELTVNPEDVKYLEVLKYIEEYLKGQIEKYAEENVYIQSYSVKDLNETYEMDNCTITIKGQLPNNVIVEVKENNEIAEDIDAQKEENEVVLDVDQDNAKDLVESDDFNDFMSDIGVDTDSLGLDKKEYMKTLAYDVNFYTIKAGVKTEYIPKTVSISFKRNDRTEENYQNTKLEVYSIESDGTENHFDYDSNTTEVSAVVINEENTQEFDDITRFEALKKGYVYNEEKEAYIKDEQYVSEDSESDEYILSDDEVNTILVEMIFDSMDEIFESEEIISLLENSELSEEKINTIKGITSFEVLESIIEDVEDSIKEQEEEIQKKLDTIEEAKEKLNQLKENAKNKEDVEESIEDIDEEIESEDTNIEDEDEDSSDEDSNTTNENNEESHESSSDEDSNDDSDSSNEESEDSSSEENTSTED